MVFINVITHFINIPYIQSVWCENEGSNRTLMMMMMIRSGGGGDGLTNDSNHSSHTTSTTTTTTTTTAQSEDDENVRRANPTHQTTTTMMMMGHCHHHHHHHLKNHKHYKNSNVRDHRNNTNNNNIHNNHDTNHMTTTTINEQTPLLISSLSLSVFSEFDDDDDECHYQNDHDDHHRHIHSQWIPPLHSYSDHHSYRYGDCHHHHHYDSNAATTTELKHQPQKPPIPIMGVSSSRPQQEDLEAYWDDINENDNNGDDGDCCCGCGCGCDCPDCIRYCGGGGVGRDRDDHSKNDDPIPCRCDLPTHEMSDRQRTIPFPSIQISHSPPHHSVSGMVRPSSSSSSLLSSSGMVWTHIYGVSILLYIVTNGVLLYINLTRTQIEIEQNCYLSFHGISFWSTFLFTLVEGVVLYHTTILPTPFPTVATTNRCTANTTTTHTSKISPFTAVPWTLGMIVWNMVSTFGIALLFTIDPYTYEHIAHVLEYIIQIGISMIDVMVVVVVMVFCITTTPSSNNNNNNAWSLRRTKSSSSPLSSQPSPSNNNYYSSVDNPIPMRLMDSTPFPEPVKNETKNTRTGRKHQTTTKTHRNDFNKNSTGTTKTYSTVLVVFEFMIAICVLLLSIVTFLFYTTNVTSPNEPAITRTMTTKDGWDGITIVFTTIRTMTTTMQHDMVIYLGGPEHAAHTMEFITEILNGIFVLIFTYT